MFTKLHATKLILNRVKIRCLYVDLRQTLALILQLVQRRVELLDVVADSVNAYCNNTDPEQCCGLVDISPGCVVQEIAARDTSN